MRQFYLFIFLLALLPLRASELFLEAESFTNKGGWCVDQQFMDVMGSPYLLAHGTGCPVEDAYTQVEVPSKDTYYIYVHTYNWTSPFCKGNGPGKFHVLVNDWKSNPVGYQGDAWQWQYAGKVKLAAGKTTIKLHDETGFEGRCDAIYLTSAPMKGNANIEQLRQRLVKGYNEVADGGKYDFVVVGAGVSGICAAVSAARLGLRVALVGDRPVLGGNNSSEVRVHLGGAIECDPYPNLGNLLKEFGPLKKGNAMPAANYCDDKKFDIVKAERNITLFTNVHVNKVEKNGSSISSVIGQNILTGRKLRLSGRLFADCTGDGCVGYLAGAQYHVGRESKTMYNEVDGVEQADKQVMGASVQWYSKKGTIPVPFPEFEYGCVFNDSSVQHVKKGEWTWETGMNKDQIKQAEQVRDYGLLVIYSNWSYLKNHSVYKDEYASLSLDWVAYVAGKRESRRLIGDYVLTQNDIEKKIAYPDATCTTSWSIDLHYPDPRNSKYFPNQEFKSICKQEEIPLYPIPYRCFYTKDIDNLFMAGRNISVSHVALGTVRVMRTCGMMGEVVGMAASVCKKYDTLPRAVGQQYFQDLKALMQEGVGKKGLPNNQLYNVGRKSHHKK